MRAIGDLNDEDNSIGIRAMKSIIRLDDQLITTIVEDARRVREKDESNPPIANMPKNLSKVFEEEADVEEYEKFHRRIKGDRLSMILKKPNSYDWVRHKPFFAKKIQFHDLKKYYLRQGKYKKPNDSYTQDFSCQRLQKKTLILILKV